MNGRDGEDRFGFGANWKAYSDLIDEDRIAVAIDSVTPFLPAEAIRSRTVLDIGCGSGLFSLAALRLGAARVVGIDLDSESVATTRRVLQRFAPHHRWECHVGDVLELEPETHGRFDIVYSWGVLHHTGAMYQALERAAACVGEGGHFLVALYGQTPLCGFWKWEKRCYVRHAPWFRALVRPVYKALYLMRIALAGQSPWTFLETYRSNRGMDWHHDVEDWLGGYPYESIRPEVARRFFAHRGFEECHSRVEDSRTGLFGTGCDEYLFRRTS